MTRAQCQALTLGSSYSKPGRCSKRNGIKTVVRASDSKRFKVCTHHLKMHAANRPLEII